MYYKSIEQLIEAAKAKEFTGVVIVDNDCVDAYQGETRVFDWHGEAPEMALLRTLQALGMKAERP